MKKFILIGKYTGSREQSTKRGSITYFQVSVNSEFPGGGTKEDIFDIKISDKVLQKGLPQKGTQIGIEGYLCSDVYRDKEGNNKCFLSLYAASIFLKTEATLNTGYVVDTSVNEGRGSDISDDDIPF